MEKLLHRSFAVAIVLLVLGAVTVFAGGRTVTWSYSQEPPNWDYRTTGLTAVTAPLLLNVWETLIQLEADGTSVGLLAKSWDESSDGLKVTFNLRQGVKFHDGSDFTAAGVSISHVDANSFLRARRVRVVLGTFW